MKGSSYMVFGVVPHCRQTKEKQAKYLESWQICQCPTHRRNMEGSTKGVQRPYNIVYRLRLKCDGTSAEPRFRPSAKRTSPFKSAGRQFSDCWQPRCVHQQ
jgi:hypothetical protein